MARELAFSVTLDDCVVETKRGSGKGGQNRNKRDTAVRIVHPPSGAVGESQEERSQLQNKKTAFVRMVNTPAFRSWAYREANGMKSEADILAEIDAELADPSVTITEVWGGKSRGWVNE